MTEKIEMLRNNNKGVHATIGFGKKTGVTERSINICLATQLYSQASLVKPTRRIMEKKCIKHGESLAGDSPSNKMRKIFFVIAAVFISTFSIGQKKSIVPYEKYDIRLDLKLPHINYLSVNPNGEFRDSKVGFNGYGIGIEYSYKINKYLESSVSIVTTFELPFPAHIDREYNKTINSYFLTLTDNFVLNKFTVGYGLNYSSNNWSEWYRDFDTIGLPTTDSKYYSNKTFGLLLNSYFRVGKTLNIGLIYRPNLLKVNKGIEIIYEHLISLELNWRIKLNKKSK